jgi:hypothetical protein
MSASAPKPRRRWPLRLALALLAVVGTPLLIIGFGRWQEGREWRAACAEADRLDPGWRWHELLASRPTVPDSENLALTAHAVHRLLPEGLPEWSDVIRDDELPLPPPVGPNPPAGPPPPLLDWRSAYASTFESELYALDPNQRLHPTPAAILRRKMAKLAPALEAARPLADQPHGHTGPSPAARYDADRITYEIQDVVPVFRLWSLLQAEDGNLDGALTSCRSLLNAVRMTADDLSPTGQLNSLLNLNMAVLQIQRVLGQGEPSPAALAGLQQRLDEEYNRPTLLTILRGKRAEVAEVMRALDDGRLTTETVARSFLTDTNPPRVTGYELIDAWLHRLKGNGWRRSYAASYLHYLTQLIELAKPSPDGLRQRAGEVAAARAALPTALMKCGAGLDQMIARERESWALLLTASAALAAERFRQQRGRWPESLGELTPEYLKMAPADPFDGQPLRYRQLADGVVIYSIGPNGVDDSGKLAGEFPEAPDTDLGVRLWDPAQRRQPPPARDAGR